MLISRNKRSLHSAAENNLPAVDVQAGEPVRKADFNVVEHKALKGSS